MKAASYFLTALLFFIVALLCIGMVNNPLFMGGNTDRFLAGYYGQGPLNEINIRYSTVSLLIFLPSVYFGIAFFITGCFQWVIEKRRMKKES